MPDSNKLKAIPEQASLPTGDQLEQVREILFGTAQRDTKGDVQRLEARIAALDAAIETERVARRTEVKALQADTDSVRDDMEARAAKIEDDVSDLGERLSDGKVDRQALAVWFEDIARKLREDGTS